jgi:dynein heavy chain
MPPIKDFYISSAFRLWISASASDDLNLSLL